MIFAYFIFFHAISANNQLLTEKKKIIANAQLIRRTLCNTDT